MDVAVEDDPDQLAGAIYDGTPRIAPDDVGRADEIEGRFQVQVLLVLDPARGQGSVNVASG
jgi:hypothetical protein